MGVKHPFVNLKADGGDDTITRPSDWNADHVTEDISADGTFAWSGDEASTVTGSQTAFNIVGTTVRWSGASGMTLHGMANGAVGRIVLWINASSGQTISFTNESGTETTAANRILTPDGTTLVVSAGTIVLLIYDEVSSRWRVVGGVASITAHEAAGDPHTGYRLESADHTHASSGLQAGTIDHGAITGLTDDDHTQYRLESADHTHASTGLQAGTIDHGVITGLSDDDHPQYVLESLYDAKGDIISASADNTPSKVTVGANDTILMADSSAAAGLKWVAAGTPSTQAFGDSAVVGTSDTFTRGDHKHAMPADPGGGGADFAALFKMGI